jgi:hypothetical protein
MKKFVMLKIMVITLSFILILIPIYTYGAGRWVQIDGEATDIGIGADGSVWIIGTNEVNGGYGVYRRSVWGWVQLEIDGGAIRIDVDPSGNPWVVDNDGNIFRKIGAEWEQIDGEATDIGIGADGSVWIIGTSEVNGGYGVYRRIVEGWVQLEIDRGAIRIDVDPSGNPWVVDNDGNIFRKIGAEWWEQIDGEATDIGIGADGSVWIIRTSEVNGGYGVYRWSERGWEQIDGGTAQISVDNRGAPWIVDSEGYIYVWKFFIIQYYRNFEL